MSNFFEKSDLSRNEAENIIINSDVVLDGTDSSSNNANDAVSYDFTNTSYFISVINETASSDGAVYVEEVTQGHPGA